MNPHRRVKELDGWQDAGLTEVDTRPMGMAYEAWQAAGGAIVDAMSHAPELAGRPIGRYLVHEQIVRRGVSAVHLGRSPQVRAVGSERELPAGPGGRRGLRTLSRRWTEHGVIAVMLAGLLWWFAAPRGLAQSRTVPPQAAKQAGLAPTSGQARSPAEPMAMAPWEVAPAPGDPATASRAGMTPDAPEQSAAEPQSSAQEESIAEEQPIAETAPVADAEVVAAQASSPHRGRGGRLHTPGRVSLARIGALNARALRAYRLGKVDTAQRLLRSALMACSGAGLGHHKITAVTHAHLGVVLVVGFKQPQLGVEQFRQALQIDPKVPLARRYARPEVAAAFREAVAST
jgi:hypothetical protein